MTVSAEPLATHPARPVSDDLPPALSSMWRLCKLGYRHEPGLLVASFLLSLAAALPDALLALWLALLGKGVLEGDRRLLLVAATGLGLSAAATWVLRVVDSRVQRRFRDRVTIALEAHVARLQASVATIAHQERPEWLDRLTVLREQVFVLDHLYMSLFSTAGWVLRLGVTVALLVSINPWLAGLALFALPTILTSAWRPAVERGAQERGAQSSRLARHLFTRPPPPPRRARRSGSPASAPGWPPTAGPPGSAGTGRWPGPAGGRRPGTRPPGRCSGPATSARSCSWPRCWTPARRRCCWCWPPGRGCRPTSGPPPSRSGSCAASGWTGRAGWPGWRTTPRRWRPRPASRCRPPWPTGSAWSACRSPTRAPTASSWTTSPSRCPRARSWPWSARTAPARRPWSSCSASCTSRPRGGSWSTAGRWARMDADAWRSRLAGAFQDFFRFELRARHSVGVGDLPRRDDEPAVAAAVGRAGAADVVGHLADGLDTQLGPTWPGGVEVSFGQWQKLALARGFMREAPLLLVLDEPTAALDAETEHALFERYAAAARSGSAHHPAGVAPVLDGADGRPDRGPGRGPPGRGGQPRRAAGPRRPVRRALRHPGRRLPRPGARPAGPGRPHRLKLGDPVAEELAVGEAVPPGCQPSRPALGMVRPPKLAWPVISPPNRCHRSRRRPGRPSGRRPAR